MKRHKKKVGLFLYSVVFRVLAENIRGENSALALVVWPRIYQMKASRRDERTRQRGPNRCGVWGGWWVQTTSSGRPRRERIRGKSCETAWKCTWPLGRRREKRRKITWLGGGADEQTISWCLKLDAYVAVEWTHSAGPIEMPIGSEKGIEEAERLCQENNELSFMVFLSLSLLLRVNFTQYWSLWEERQFLSLRNSWKFMVSRNILFLCLWFFEVPD